MPLGKNTQQPQPYNSLKVCKGLLIEDMHGV